MIRGQKAVEVYRPKFHLPALRFAHPRLAGAGLRLRHRLFRKTAEQVPLRHQHLHQNRFDGITPGVHPKDKDSQILRSFPSASPSPRNEAG
jgi:hypothetical protein